MRTLIKLCALALLVAIAAGVPAKSLASETPGRHLGDPGESRWKGLFCCSCCLLDDGNSSAAISSPAAPSAEQPTSNSLHAPRIRLSQWVARALVLRLI